MNDSDRLWQVYRPEWLVVYTSDTDGEEGRNECLRRYEKDFEGRVVPDDCRTVPWSLDHPEWWPWMLELRLPVLKGEYTARPAALEHARKIDGVAVLEGSRVARKLLSYGGQMLRKGSVDSQEVDAADAARGAESQLG